MTPTTKYRFSARFANGTTYTQPDDDLHPSIPGRNAFYELLQKDAAGNPIMGPEGDWLWSRPDITEFWVEGPDQRCRVDLRTGKIYIAQAVRNGAASHRQPASDRVGPGRYTKDGLFLHPRLIPVPAGARLYLVWFRRHRVHQNVGVLGQAEGESYESPIEFHLGWRAYVDGRKHEQTVVLT